MNVYTFLPHTPINLTIPADGFLLNSLKFTKYAIISPKMDVFKWHATI